MVLLRKLNTIGDELKSKLVDSLTTDVDTNWNTNELILSDDM
jgi:hypothetical protein